MGTYRRMLSLKTLKNQFVISFLYGQPKPMPKRNILVGNVALRDTFKNMSKISLNYNTLC